jgi:hypothetical protein
MHGIAGPGQLEQRKKERSTSTSTVASGKQVVVPPVRRRRRKRKRACRLVKERRVICRNIAAVDTLRYYLQSQNAAIARTTAAVAVGMALVMAIIAMTMAACYECPQGGLGRYTLCELVLGVLITLRVLLALVLMLVLMVVVVVVSVEPL